MKKTPQEIRTGLRDFYGTEKYYRYIGGINLTDGVKWLADAAQCYWLLDILVSAQLIAKVRKKEFQVLKLKVDLANTTAVATIEDGNRNVVYTQEIEYTDFPLEAIEIWFINNVMLLPSEN